MTDLELIDGNKVIANFIGVKKWVDVNTLHMSNSAQFHYSWNALMPAIRKINSLGKEFQFAIFKTYVSCTVEKAGKFYKDFSFSHAEYITVEQTDIQAAYKLVVKFVKWYDEINSVKSLEIPK